MWLALYFVTIAGDGLLLGWLVRKRVWKTHPAFVAYIAFALVRTLALWPLRAAVMSTEYRNVWWYSEIFYLAILGAVAGETWRQRTRGIVAGCTTAFCVLVLLRLSYALYPKHVEYVWGLAYTEISVFRYAGLFAAACFAVYGSTHNSGRAIGLTIVSLARALVMDMDLFRGSSSLGYITVAAWTVALFLWLAWVRNYQVRISSADRFRCDRENPRHASLVLLPRPVNR